MSFFLFVKQLVDMLYPYKFLDYCMVGLVLMLLVYQVLLVRPEWKKWISGTDGLIVMLGILLTLSFFKSVHAYENYFKVFSAFLLYFVGRLYYERIQECYGSLVTSSYIIVYCNFIHRLANFKSDLFTVTDAGGDLYYYDTDMAFAIVLSTVFITMFGKNTIVKLLTIFFVCPYMVFYSDAGIQKVLMLVVYGIIFLYLTEIIFRSKRIASLLLMCMILGIIAVVLIIYLPVMGYRNDNLLAGIFGGSLLDFNNMYFRYRDWKEIISSFMEQPLLMQFFGVSMDAGVPVESLYIKLLYVCGYAGLLLAFIMICYITYYVVKIQDRKTFYLAVMMAVILLGTGVTVNSMECVQMSWFPMLFTGMVVSSVKEGVALEG